MAAQKRRAVSKKTAAAAATAVAQPEALQQEVMRHFAKTVYFNDIWKSFLSKLAGLVALLSIVTLQKMRDSDAGLGFVALFEVVSVVLALATVIFLHRFFAALFVFKLCFVLSLLQLVWWGSTVYTRFAEQDPKIGDLELDQFPFGTLYFFVCWASDRFMLRSAEDARQTAEEVQEVVAKVK